MSNSSNNSSNFNFSPDANFDFNRVFLGTTINQNIIIGCDSTFKQQPQPSFSTKYIAKENVDPSSTKNNKNLNDSLFFDSSPYFSSPGKIIYLY
jgi:hypothetical protein